MLFTFNFKAKDSNSDRGTADVTIVASDESGARQDLALLLTTKQRHDLTSRFKLISTRAYTTGVVFENVEAKVEELQDAD